MKKKTKSPEYITSKQLADDYGIDNQQQIQLLYNEKLTAYRIISKLQPVYPSMNPPYANCKNPKPYPPPDLPAEAKGLPVRAERKAEYQQIPLVDIGAINKEGMAVLYFKRDEVASIEPIQETQAHKKSGSKDRLYEMLAAAMKDYYEKANHQPGDPYVLDREIWSYPAVGRVIKMIGTPKLSSVKSGLRRRGYKSLLPKLPGGSGKKAVK